MKREPEPLTHRSGAQGRFDITHQSRETDDHPAVQYGRAVAISITFDGARIVPKQATSRRGCGDIGKMDMAFPQQRLPVPDFQAPVAFGQPSSKWPKLDAKRSKIIRRFDHRQAGEAENAFPVDLRHHGHSVENADEPESQARRHGQDQDPPAVTEAGQMAQETPKGQRRGIGKPIYVAARLWRRRYPDQGFRQIGDMNGLNPPPRIQHRQHGQPNQFVHHSPLARHFAAIHHADPGGDLIGAGKFGFRRSLYPAVAVQCAGPGRDARAKNKPYYAASTRRLQKFPYGEQVHIVFQPPVRVPIMGEMDNRARSRPSVGRRERFGGHG